MNLTHYNIIYREMDDDIVAQQAAKLMANKTGKPKGPKKPLLSNTRDKTTFDSANFFKEKEEQEQKNKPKDNDD